MLAVVCCKAKGVSDGTSGLALIISFTVVFSTAIGVSRDTNNLDIGDAPMLSCSHRIVLIPHTKHSDGDQALILPKYHPKIIDTGVSPSFVSH